MRTLTITRPDDWHIHLRDGAYLPRTVADAAQQFHRAIVMPNLVPPVSNTAEAQSYRERINAARPAGSDFEPLMVLYLTDNTDPAEMAIAKASGFVHACKLYPAGATTNSSSGVTDIKKIYPVIAAMEKAGLPLLLHGEVTDNYIDIFDREAVFIERTLQPLTRDFPALKIVLEHITTRDAVAFVKDASQQVAATITAHHLLLNRNNMLVGGIRPHLFCLPILKRDIHQQALLEAATSSNPKFFLGTDSAPHAQHKKETACGCAGCYTALHALELYAEVFDRAGKLDKLEGFASFFGADFYGLPRNTDSITLIEQEQTVVNSLQFGDEALVPLLAGDTLRWSLQGARA
ncbi:MAG: dihydroorotase [Pseudomonadales bacterium]